MDVVTLLVGATTLLGYVYVKCVYQRLCSKIGLNYAERFMRVDADLCRWRTACHYLRRFDRVPAENGDAQISRQPYGRCSFPTSPVFFFFFLNETRPWSFY